MITKGQDRASPPRGTRALTAKQQREAAQARQKLDADRDTALNADGKSPTYEVTLRRDIQQVTCVRVQASSRQEAIDIAETVTDAEAWNLEEHIGSHKPQVRKVR